jgi:hypothetical protein
MSKIEAKIVADSINTFGDRITTMQVTLPRIILSELLTHRMFSRNSASSRAIPFKKMVQSVHDNPFIPIAFQLDHPGMQGTKYVTEPFRIKNCESEWLRGITYALNAAHDLGVEGVTKQLLNRMIEPYMWHTVLITSTSWNNFFELRCPQYVFPIAARPEKLYRSWKDVITDASDLTTFDKDLATSLEQYSTLQKLQQNIGQAEIHMMSLAEAMWDVYNESEPKKLQVGQWHIPFEEKIILPPSIPIDAGYTLEEGVNIRKAKISTAMCARISYTVVGEEGKEPNHDNDIMLHDRLVESKHASPFEHIAQAVDSNVKSRNFTGGWLQYREIINL